MRTYTAMVQFRTSLDQAGRISGLAGELEVSESEVARQLLELALDHLGRDALRVLRLAIEHDRPSQPTEDEIELAIAQGRTRSRGASDDGT